MSDQFVGRKFITSRWKLFLVLIGGIALVLASYFATQKPVLTSSEYFMAWFGLVFFSAGLLAISYLLIRADEVLIINSEGFYYSRLSPDFVPWSEVKKISVITIRFNRFLTLHLYDPEKFHEHLSPRQKKFAKFFSKIDTLADVGQVAIVTSGLNGSYREIRDELVNNFEAFKKAEPKKI